MEGLAIAIDPAWASGLLLALTRMSAFVAASPILNKSMPLPGRLMTALALALFLSEPVAPMGVGELVVASVTNAAVGIVLGFLTGVIFHIFAVAGGVIDMASGLAVSAMVDPSMGQQAAIFGRIFNITALTLFMVIGGMEVVVRGLATSITAIPLDGSISPQGGLATVAVALVGRLMLAGIELALPVLAALFLAEVVLGLAARFAPQANVFILGLPLKILIAITVVGMSFMFFPEAMDGVLRSMRDTFCDGLRGLMI
jgi:flagellar biosynthesis protein FliR